MVGPVVDLVKSPGQRGVPDQGGTGTSRAVCLGVNGIAASQNGGVLIQRSGFGDPGAQLPSVLQRSLGVQASSLVMVGCRPSQMGRHWMSLARPPFYFFQL